MYSEKTLRRFWAKVAKSNGCWLWQASKSIAGYGQFKLRSYVGVFAHRLSWEIAHGVIADGLWVLHKCDTPACVNPEHLFLGTCVDNVRDMYAKGRNAPIPRPPLAALPRGSDHFLRKHPERAPRGERCGVSKLKATQVIEIRQLAGVGRSKSDLAALFGVTQPTIHKIVRRLRWAHLP